MPSINTVRAQLPSAEELQRLDDFEEEFPLQIARAIRWIYDIHDWNGEDVEKRIPGVKASVWQRYAQPAYTKSRSLHSIAALSWISQVSMSAILYGDRIARYWPDTTRNKIKIIIYSGLMGHEEFQYIMDKLLAISPNKVDLNRDSLAYLEYFKSNYKYEHVAAPAQLDIEAFARDYYRSIAVTLKTFRESRNMRVTDMAITMNISDAKYRKIENANPPPKVISLHLAARFKLAFKIPNTVPFVSDMRDFPGFALSRSLHQARELILLELLKGVDEKAVAEIAMSCRQLTNIQENLSRCVQI